MSDRKKPSLAFWATVALVAMLAAYPLSFGPVCWLTKRNEMTFDRIAPRVYWPIGWISMKAPRPLRNVISWYATVGNSNVILIPVNPSGSTITGFSR